MAWDSGPWNGDDFGESEWSYLFGRGLGAKLLNIGSMSPSASTRELSWSGAVAIVNGMMSTQSGTEVFDFPVPGGSNRRIDYLILRYDASQPLIPDKLKAEMKLGTPALNPSAPALTQDYDGIFEMPVYRIGPWGTGTISSAPRLDMRNYRTVVRGASTRDALFNQGNVLGDIGFTPDNIYRHDGDTWVPYLGNPDSALIYSTPDQGWPQRKDFNSGNPIITNQLTIPSVGYRRTLLISAQHYLNIAAGANQFDSIMLLGSSDTPHRRARHASSGTERIESTVTLSTVYTLPENQSLRIRIGGIRVNEDPTGALATTSAQAAYNNINVISAPTYLFQSNAIQL